MDARNRLTNVYRAEIGVAEATGRNDGSRVEEYLGYCGLESGHPWCAAFVSWCFGQAGFAQPRNPWSPALFPGSRTVWTKGQSMVKPQQGQVFGIHYPALGRIAHVGFVDQAAGSWMVSVEGNASNRVQRKRRHLRNIHALAEWLPQPVKL